MIILSNEFTEVYDPYEAESVTWPVDLLSACNQGKGGGRPPPAPIFVFAPPTPAPVAPVQREAPKPLPVVKATTPEQKKRRRQANLGRQASVLTSGQGVTDPLGGEGITRPAAGRLG